MTEVETSTKNRWGNIPPAQIVERADRPDEPVYKGPGSSVRSASEDYSDGRILSRYVSGAATKIDWRPKKLNLSRKARCQWRRMQRHQDGNAPIWNGEGKERPSFAEKEHRRDKKRISGALSEQLDLNLGEKREVLRLCTKLDCDDFGTHKGLHRVILGLIAVVVETRRVQFGAEFEATRIHLHEAFKSLMESEGITVNHLHTIKREVRRQLKRFGY